MLVWNEETLDAIRSLSPGPTVAVRALAVVHTAIYDAWAAYDPVAVGTRLGANLRRPTAERTQANKERAVSFAAYLALVDLFPARQAVFAQRMAALGYAIDGTDTSTPAMVGTTAGAGGGGLSAQRRGQPAQWLCRHQRLCAGQHLGPGPGPGPLAAAVCAPAAAGGDRVPRPAEVPDPALAHRGPVWAEVGGPVPARPRPGGDGREGQAQRRLSSKRSTSSCCTAPA